MTDIAPPSGAVLCRLDDLAAERPFETRLGEGGADPTIILFRCGDDVRAYRNRCPHFQIPLNARPSGFLSAGQGLIMCAFHSAVFRIDDGLCVDGPCKGARLEPIPVRRQGDEVLVA